MRRPLLLALALAASPALAGPDSPSPGERESSEEERTVTKPAAPAPRRPAPAPAKRKPAKKKKPAPQSAEHRPAPTKQPRPPATRSGGAPAPSMSTGTGGGGRVSKPGATSPPARSGVTKPLATTETDGGGAPAPSMSTGTQGTAGPGDRAPAVDTSQAPVSKPADASRAPVRKPVDTSQAPVSKPMDASRAPVRKPVDASAPQRSAEPGGSASREPGTRATGGEAPEERDNGAIYGAYGVGAAAALGLGAAAAASHGGSGTGEVAKVPRRQTLALGVRVGGLVGPKETEGSFHDLGLGLTARYRPLAPLGLELSGNHYDQSWAPQSDRRHTLISQSVGGFLFPERAVQPYAMVGFSELFRFVREEGASAMTRDIAVGPHAGAGVELALGPRFGIDLEGRYTHFLGERTGTEPRGIVATNLGFVFHL